MHPIASIIANDPFHYGRAPWFQTIGFVGIFGADCGGDVSRFDSGLSDRHGLSTRANDKMFKQTVVALRC